MQLARQHLPTRRSAATAVETGVVLGVCLLFMFGIFEYGRFFLMKHLLENAAREGARFAVAHTNDSTESDIRDAVMKYLAKQDLKLDNFNKDTSIEIFALVLRQSDPTIPVGTQLSSWDQAKPTDGIVIRITANYRSTLPTFLGMPDVITMQAQSVMYSEGN